MTAKKLYNYNGDDVCTNENPWLKIYTSPSRLTFGIIIYIGELYQISD